MEENGATAVAPGSFPTKWQGQNAVQILTLFLCVLGLQPTSQEQSRLQTHKSFLRGPHIGKVSDTGASLHILGVLPVAYPLTDFLKFLF